MSGVALSQNQQFEDADNWLQLIFNPTDTSHYTGVNKFWETKPFFKNADATQTIDQIILGYAGNPGQPAGVLENQVNAWRNNPELDPHLLAQIRVISIHVCGFYALPGQPDGLGQL